MQGQLAVKTHAHQLITSSKKLVYTELCRDGAAAAWLDRQPELKHLERCLRLHLSGYPEAGEAALLDNLARTRGNEVRARALPSNPAKPYPCACRSTMAGVGQGLGGDSPG